MGYPEMDMGHENDWLEEQWGPSSATLGLGSNLNTYPSPWASPRLHHPHSPPKLTHDLFIQIRRKRQWNFDDLAIGAAYIGMDGLLDGTASMATLTKNRSSANSRSPKPPNCSSPWNTVDFLLFLSSWPPPPPASSSPPWTLCCHNHAFQTRRKNPSLALRQLVKTSLLFKPLAVIFRHPTIWLMILLLLPLTPTSLFSTDFTSMSQEHTPTRRHHFQRCSHKFQKKESASKEQLKRTSWERSQ